MKFRKLIGYFGIILVLSTTIALGARASLGIFVGDNTFLENITSVMIPERKLNIIG
jgi:hypothetical protein